MYIYFYIAWPYASSVLVPCQCCPAGIGYKSDTFIGDYNDCCNGGSCGGPVIYSTCPAPTSFCRSYEYSCPSGCRPCGCYGYNGCNSESFCNRNCCTSCCSSPCCGYSNSCSSPCYGGCKFFF